MVDIIGLIESYPYVFLILFLIIAGFISHRISKKRKERHRIKNYLKDSGFLDVKKEVAISKRISSVKPRSNSGSNKGVGFFGAIKNWIDSFKESYRTKKRLKRLANKDDRKQRKITVKKLLKEKEKENRTSKGISFKEKFKGLITLKKGKVSKISKEKPTSLGNFMKKDTNFALLTLIIIIAISLVGATIFYQFMLSQLNTKYSEKEAELNQTVQLLNQKKTLLDEAQEALELTNKREEQITGQYTEVKEDFNSCESENTELTKRNSDLETQVSSLNDQISSLNAEVELKNNRIEDLEEDVDRCEGERNTCQSSLSTCQTDLVACQGS